MQTKITIFILFILFSLLTACSSLTKPKEPCPIDPTDCAQLKGLKSEPLTHEGSSGCCGGDEMPAGGLTNLRNKVLQDTAMSISAQGGLAWASKVINRKLECDRWYLDTIYNFNGMMLSHGVLPPVLEEGTNTLNLADPNTIRVADRIYKIVQQARFATTPPNWREYLWMSFSKPELPHKTLLPRTKEESEAWAKGVECGWEKGVQQAYNIFRQNLARLKRDYNGMILYRKLLQAKMISQPYVSRTELGVTGDGTDMRVNDQVLRITELPRLQTETKGWKAIVVKNEDP